MLSIKELAGIALVGTLLGVSGISQAQTCTANADCPTGMTCQESGVVVAIPPTKCSIDAGACGSIALPPQVVSTCQAAPCQTDADCGADMICHSQTFTACTGGASVKCNPNAADCQPVPTLPPTCTDTTVSKCAYKWDLPCNADADCGAGFVCEPSVSATCSASSGPANGSSGTGSGSSSGVGGAGGSVAVPPSPPSPSPITPGPVPTPECTTTTSFPGSCQPKVKTCNVDADCPSVLKCADMSVYAGRDSTASGGATGTSPGSGEGTVSSGTAPPDAMDAGAAPAPIPMPVPPMNTQTATATATATATSTATETTIKMCQKPYSHGQSIGMGGSEGVRGTTSSKDTNSAVAAPDAGAKGTTNAIPPSPAAPSAAPPSGNGATKPQTAATTSGGGCTVVSGTLSGDSALILTLLGGLVLVRARRNRKA